MKWLWVVSEELHPTTCKMPTQLKYFIDPMSIIQYSGCKLHAKHSGISDSGYTTTGWLMQQSILATCLLSTLQRREQQPTQSTHG
jgi:hypothetical protein